MGGGGGDERGIKKKRKKDDCWRSKSVLKPLLLTIRLNLASSGSNSIYRN